MCLEVSGRDSFSFYQIEFDVDQMHQRGEGLEEGRSRNST